MSDRELLELAAKAAGLDVEFPDADTADWLVCNDHAKAHDQWLICNSLDEEGDVIGWWNPLKDDGDALRLAVKLGMRLCIDKRAGFSWIKGVEGSVPHDGNANAATRRAIVRAAAEIARAQPSVQGGGSEPN
ncbi:conserved protein of unknown function [Ralstonia solanacearum CMR15]|nr:conserved protein of unknown function [Ralstonia solanacearum CMR15]